MYAVQANNNLWYRGIVIQINYSESPHLYTIHCIDYGFTEMLTADRYHIISIQL